jgi:uncharacterized membrane protein
MMRMSRRIMVFTRPSRASSRIPSAVLAIGAAAWLLLIVSAPYVVGHFPRGTAAWRAGGLVYLVGHAVCHQRADRSFHAWGIPLPVCGRCFGLYAGAALGALVAAMAAAARETPNLVTEWRCRLAVSALPTALSFGLEAIGLWSQTPTLRAVAAAPLGFAVAWFVGSHAAEVFGRVRLLVWDTL